eukprot:g12552.t1
MLLTWVAFLLWGRTGLAIPGEGESCPGYGVETGQGWTIVRQMFCGDKMKQIEAWVEEARDLPELNESFSQGVFKSFEEVTGKAAVLTRVEKMIDSHVGFRTLLGPEGSIMAAVVNTTNEKMFLYKEKIHFKPPGGGGYRWHIDGYFRLKPKNIRKQDYICKITVTAIDDIDLSNGCMYIMPTAWPSHSDRKSWNYVGTEVGMPVLVKRGDVLIYDQWMPHMSAENTAPDRSRRTLFAVYSPAKFGDVRVKYYEHEQKYRRAQMIKPNVFFTGKGAKSGRLKRLQDVIIADSLSSV